MDRNKQIFAVGLLMGVIITATFCFFFAPRYDISNSAKNAIKLDRWTGESWRFSNGDWKKIEKIEQDWKQIDKALAGALNLKKEDTDSEEHTSNLLNLLKEKYPVLETVQNEELLERINIVYSKAILTDLYLKNVEQIHNKQELDFE